MLKVERLIKETKLKKGDRQRTLHPTVVDEEMFTWLFDITDLNLFIAILDFFKFTKAKRESCLERCWLEPEVNWESLLLVLTFPLRNKCPYSKLFWSAFSSIRNKYLEGSNLTGRKAGINDKYFRFFWIGRYQWPLIERIEETSNFGIWYRTSVLPKVAIGRI